MTLMEYVKSRPTPFYVKYHIERLHDDGGVKLTGAGPYRIEVEVKLKYMLVVDTLHSKADYRWANLRVDETTFTDASTRFAGGGVFTLNDALTRFEELMKEAHIHESPPPVIEVDCTIPIPEVNTVEELRGRFRNAV